MVVMVAMVVMVVGVSVRVGAGVGAGVWKMVVDAAARKGGKDVNNLEILRAHLCLLMNTYPPFESGPML